MTAQELDALQALCDGATEAPWRAIINREVEQFRVSNSSWGVCETMNDSDAQFIAASRTAMPALISEVRRLTAESDARLTGLRECECATCKHAKDYWAPGLCDKCIRCGGQEERWEWCGPQPAKEDDQ